MRQFRFERVTQIAAGQGPVSLMDYHCLILHVVPFSHFVPGQVISISDVVRNTQSFPPLGTTLRQDWRINFEGFVTLSNSLERAETQRAYVQLFRSGAIEAVASSISNAKRFVNVVDIARMIVGHLYLYSGALRDCGVQPPFAVMASLIGLDKMMLTTGRRSITGQTERQIADRDQFHFTEVILENVPATIEECAKILPGRC